VYLNVHDEVWRTKTEAWKHHINKHL